MKKLLILALLLIPVQAHADPFKLCKTYKALAANCVAGTCTSTIYEFGQHSTMMSFWFRILTPGTGTPLGQVNIFGPEAEPGERISGVLIPPGSEFSAANGKYRQGDPLMATIEGVQFVVTDCTGTCSVRMSACGVGTR